MTTVITYIAFDGKNFDNENDCQRYESNLKIEELNVKLWDEYHNLLPNSLSGFENCFYFRAATQDTFNALVELLDETGSVTDGLNRDIWDGLWGWTNEDGYWVNYNELYNYYKEKIEIMI